jgi:hypothetical protein
MPSLNNITHELDFHNRKDIVKEDHDTNDIIKCIKKQHPVFAKQYDKICEMHWNGNAYDTARDLFHFLKKNVVYDIENAEDQSVKSPGAILKQGYGDCKHYASYIVGVCDALHRAGYKIAAKYRFTADTPSIDVHHVFAVVEDSNNHISSPGKEIYCDPVLGSFNEKPNYYNIKDIKPMPLSVISGSEIGKKHNNIFKKLWHGIEVAKADTDKGAKQALKKAGQGIEKAAHLILNVSVAPARNSFLALVDLNAFNMAHRLHDTLQGPHAHDLDKTWKKLGGDPKKLANAIANGYKQYLKHHPKKKVSGIGNSQVGVIQVAALLALAGSIIAALQKFMKPSPGEAKEMGDLAKEGAIQIAKNASQGADIANGEAGDQAAAALDKAASGGPSMKVSASTDENGNPAITVHDVQHPALDAAGTTGGGADKFSPDGGSNTYVPGAQTQPESQPDGAQTSGISDMFTKITNYVTEHKTAIITTASVAVVGVVAVKLIGKKKRRR